MTNCVFCKIAKKELPSDIIYEDGKIVAFKDIHPRAPLHYLIIPKNHLNSMASNNSEEVAKDLLIIAKRIAVQQGLGSYKLVFNVGPEAGQTVPHLHLHLLSGGGSELKI